MTKDELAKSIASKLNINKREAYPFIEAMIDTIGSTMVSGESLTLVGLGSFTPKIKRERKGHNPKNFEPVVIPEKRYISFKMSKLLKDAMNA